MTKKWIILGGAAVATLAIVIYFNMEKEIEEPIAIASSDLPKLNVQLTDGSNLQLSDQLGQVILVFFNPECDHCQRQAMKINDQKSVFDNYDLYFIAADVMDSVAKFRVDYDLVETNFHFGRADSGQVFEAVGTLSAMPTFFIYKSGKLIKRIDGQIKPEAIKEFL